jgi:hypothetical protein
VQGSTKVIENRVGGRSRRSLEENSSRDIFFYFGQKPHDAILRSFIVAVFN